jgi:hypothetical protein
MKVCIKMKDAIRRSPRKHDTTANSVDTCNMYLPMHQKNIMSSKESLEIEVQCTRLQAVRFMLNRKSLYWPMQPLTRHGTV